MKSYRLGKISKELNVGISTLVNYLKVFEFEIDSNPNSKVPFSIYEKLIKQYGDVDSIEKIIMDSNKKVIAINHNSKSNLITFNELFKNNLFRIPDYQRGYSWSKRELDDLWRDIMDLSSSSFHFTGIITLEPVSNSSKFRFEKEEAFLGKFNSENEIVLQNDIFTPYFIVDGQQRLTTIIILLSVILEISKEKNLDYVDQDFIEKIFTVNAESSNVIFKFGYEKDTPSHQYLLSKILNDKSILITEPETIYTKNLIESKKYFKSKFKEIESNQRSVIQEVFLKIKNNLLFNLLILDSNQVDISMVFETLNYRGKSLSKLEILKNRIIYLASKRYSNENEIYIGVREKVTKTWLHIYEWLGKGKNNFSQIDDDNFLRAFWILYFNHDDINESDFKNFEKDLFENIFKINESSKNRLLNLDNLYHFLDTIENAVKAWYYINYPVKNWNDNLHVNNEFVDYLQRLNRIIQGRYMQILIMAALIRPNEFDNQEENKEWMLALIKEIERHNVVLFLINGKSNDTDRAYCYRLSNQFFEHRKDGKTFHTTREFLKKSVQKHHNIYNFINHIHHNRANNEQFWDWNGRNYILWLYESELGNVNNASVESFEKFDAYKYYQFSNHWNTPEFSTLKRSQKESNEKIENSIGNIFLRYSNNKKQAISNLTFNEIEFLVDSKEWTLKKIIDRGSNILNFISKTYNIKLEQSSYNHLILNGVRDTNDKE